MKGSEFKFLAMSMLLSGFSAGLHSCGEPFGGRENVCISTGKSM